CSGIAQASVHPRQHEGPEPCCVGGAVSEGSPLPMRTWMDGCLCNASANEELRTPGNGSQGGPAADHDTLIVFDGGALAPVVRRTWLTLMMSSIFVLVHQPRPAVATEGNTPSSPGRTGCGMFSYFVCCIR